LHPVHECSNSSISYFSFLITHHVVVALCCRRSKEMSLRWEAETSIALLADDLFRATIKRRHRWSRRGLLWYTEHTRSDLIWPACTHIFGCLVSRCDGKVLCSWAQISPDDRHTAIVIHEERERERECVCVCVCVWRRKLTVILHTCIQRWNCGSLSLIHRVCVCVCVCVCCHFHSQLICSYLIFSRWDTTLPQDDCLEFAPVKLSEFVLDERERQTWLDFTLNLFSWINPLHVRLVQCPPLHRAVFGLILRVKVKSRAWSQREGIESISTKSAHCMLDAGFLASIPLKINTYCISTGWRSFRGRVTNDQAPSPPSAYEISTMFQSLRLSLMPQ